MPTTSNGLPYPANTGVAPNVPLHIQQLAEALDDGALDTGWVTFTVEPAYEAKSGSLGVRRVGSTVQMRGLLGAVVGNLPTTQTILGTLPAGFRPAQSEWFAVGSTNGQEAQTLVITNGGLLQYRPRSAALYIGLAAVRFLVG